MPRNRCLWAAALLVLCMSLAAGAAFGQDAWKAVTDNFPSQMVWDQKTNVSVDAQNTGSTTWDSNFSLRSVQGTTASAFEVDRWGTTSVPVVGTVAPGATLRFSFGITAPPITTVDYPVPATPTTPPTISSLPSDWMLADHSALVRTDVDTNDITVERFPDMLPSTGENWAAPFVEELAGHVPVFVQGYPDGTYQPTLNVTRDQMAVFIDRAVANGDQNVPTGPSTATFSDVPTTFWAYNWIEDAVNRGIVQGYSDKTYRPAENVTRDQMAVFVARGMVGGDAKVPAGPTTATFPDVPTNYWAFKYIEFAVAQNVVKGYPTGSYLPQVPVTRDQMAVFVYRAFVQPSGSTVVLAGPAITRLDPVPSTYDGFSSILAATGAEPATAYVALDAARMTPDMAPITVNFQLREESATTGAASATVHISAADITAAQAAMNTSGGRPYFYVVWDIDSAAPPKGDYTLYTFVNGAQIPRTVPFTVR